MFDFEETQIYFLFEKNTKVIYTSSYVFIA